MTALLAALTVLSDLKAATVQVQVDGDNCVFTPQAVNAFAGDTVQWNWISGLSSTVSGTPGAPDGRWDSGLQSVGATFCHTFTAPGTFPYFSDSSATMIGTVTVFPPKWPVGFYSLTEDGSDIIGSDQLLTKDWVTGFRLRLYIRDILKDGPTPDWTELDAAISEAKAAGKKIGVSIAWGRYCPDWVFASGVYEFLVDPADNNLGSNPNSYMPLPWDTTYQQYLFNFIDEFAARYDNDPTVQYIAITGFQQLVENRLINNYNGSYALNNDVSLTNKQKGSYCEVQSQSANFTPTNIPPTFFDITDKGISSPYLPVNSKVCNPSEDPTCPAAPAPHVVYVNQKASQKAVNQAATVLEWQILNGDEAKADAEASSLTYDDTSPADGEVFVGFSNWVPSSTPGFASMRAYMTAMIGTEGSLGILDKWVHAFPHTPVVLTEQSPFSANNPWNTPASEDLKKYIQTYPLGGYMTASLQAVCNYDASKIHQTLTPKGDQMLSFFSDPKTDIYKSSCPMPTPTPGAQTVNDACEAALERGDSWFEPYYHDMLTDQDQSPPAMAQAWEANKPSFTSPLPQLVSAVSRLTHAGVGDFDVPLPFTGPVGIEDRLANCYQIVLTFDKPVQSGIATLASGTGIIGTLVFSGNTISVPLTGIVNGEVVTLLISQLNGLQTDFAGADIGFLVGDVNGDGFTNGGDTVLVRGDSGADVDATTFRADVNLDGYINGGDTVIVQDNSGTALP